MDTKKEQILQIVQTMRQFDISMEDVAVEYYVSTQQTNENTINKFDLLMRNELNTLRVPFRKRDEFKELEVVGIFPFKEKNFYLKLEELSETKRSYAYEYKLPSVKEFESLFEIRNSLNKALILLNKPILNGYYFAKSNLKFSSAPNIIVAFDDVSETMPYDAYDTDETAKIRYCDYILCENVK